MSTSTKRCGTKCSFKQTLLDRCRADLWFDPTAISRKSHPSMPVLQWGLWKEVHREVISWFKPNRLIRRSYCKADLAWPQCTIELWFVSAVTVSGMFEQCAKRCGTKCSFMQTLLDRCRADLWFDPTAILSPSHPSTPVRVMKISAVLADPASASDWFLHTPYLD